MMNFTFKMVCSFVLLFFFLPSINAQDTIRLNNPSFEDVPKNSMSPKGWVDCGFDGETPPDVQPGGGFEVTKGAFHGKTYLGMVCRDNFTNEAVSQKLERELYPEVCYKLSLRLCRSENYQSLSKATNLPSNYIIPISAEIWLGKSPCGMGFLAGRTERVIHTDWQEYIFEFMPDDFYDHILIIAGTEDDVQKGINGNLLFDDASEIVSFDCKN
jgi:hypothetical protein